MKNLMFLAVILAINSCSSITISTYPHTIRPPVPNSNPNPLLPNSIDELYVSPHMDDAALSAAARIMQQSHDGKKVMVVTVFGRGPEAIDPFDDGLWTNYMDRTIEDLIVMKAMKAYYLYLNFPEYIFRKPTEKFTGPPASELVKQEAMALNGIIKKYLKPGGAVFFPLAVGDPSHPDHIVSFLAGKSIALQPNRTFDVYFWEDMPYAVQLGCSQNSPYSCVDKRIKEVTAMGLELEAQPYEVSSKRLSDKVDVLFKYTTQIWSKALFDDIDGDVTPQKITDGFKKYARFAGAPENRFIERYYLVKN